MASFRALSCPACLVFPVQRSAKISPFSSHKHGVPRPAQPWTHNRVDVAAFTGVKKEPQELGVRMFREDAVLTSP